MRPKKGNLLNNPLRRSLRLHNFDYTQEGGYFITLCTAVRLPLFGAVVGDQVVLSQIGKIVECEWLRSEVVRREVVLDEFVIMPNHFHAVVFIIYGDELRSPSPDKAHCRAPLQRSARSLGTLIAQFKTAVTTRARREMRLPNQAIWQRNYYDHIIRNDRELYQIRNYIRENPLKWQLDKYHR